MFVSQRISENQNAIPDILDEAEWGLQSLIALQDTDGGVGFDPNTNMFIESASDPNFVEVAERDPWKQESYAKHAKGTLITAALMGMASRLWRDLGAMDKAERYLTSATSAYEWAQQNGAENYVDTYAWAAAELAKTTREPSYLEDFRATGYALSGSFDDGLIIDEPVPEPPVIYRGSSFDAEHSDDEIIDEDEEALLAPIEPRRCAAAGPASWY